MEDTGNSARTAIVEMPIAELIAAPLEAAVDAQYKLAQSTVDFITSVGFYKDRDGNDITRNLTFTIQRPGEKGAEPDQMSVQAPLLALVPVPGLAIEEMNIDFQMEVTSTDKIEEKSGTDGKSEDRISVAGKISSNADHTRQTNQSAKYQIQLKARKQEPPEGLSRLLDILASTVQGN
jgi:hypothetical protein